MPPQPISESTFTNEYNDLSTKISRLHLESARILLAKFLDAVKLTLRTNYFNENRYGLGLRVHPTVMVNPDRTIPFGVVFSHGRNYNGFHCRFRDIARGGLRIVTPPNGAPPR